MKKIDDDDLWIERRCGELSEAEGQLERWMSRLSLSLQNASLFGRIIAKRALAILFSNDCSHVLLMLQDDDAAFQNAPFLSR